MTVEVEIVCIGNELLIGKTLNTNAKWIAKKATSLGAEVKRITVVGDNINYIATIIREALERAPKFIITTGGLGPTFDDKTLEGIAKALNVKLEVNENALKMVKEKYEAYAQKNKTGKIELTPPRVKMATLPKNANPLHNPIGTAPGTVTKTKQAFILTLPGVPSEMEAIFEESITPLIKKETGNLSLFEKSIFAENIMESAIAPLIDQTMRENIKVYIKSHPKGEEKMPRLELHFSTMADDSKIAKSCLNKAITHLSDLITKNGGKIKTLRRGQ